MLFSVILIDNLNKDNFIRKQRKLNYNSNLYKNICNYKYIYFCINFKINIQIRINLNKCHIYYFFIKKCKRIIYLCVFCKYTKSSIYFFCTNNILDFINFYSSIKDYMLLYKFNNNYYSNTCLNKIQNNNYYYSNILNLYYNNLLNLIILLKNIF